MRKKYSSEFKAKVALAAIKKILADYIGKGETFSITDPGKMEGDGRPNLIMLNGLQGFAFDLDLPINEEWSDLNVICQRSVWKNLCVSF